MAAQTHTLTTDQLRMLVDAMHGVVAECRVLGIGLEVAHALGCLTRNTPEAHTLSTVQLSNLVSMMDGGKDWPKHTEDPLVNFAVDCVVMYDSGEEEPVFDSAMYIAEIEAWNAHFGAPQG